MTQSNSTLRAVQSATPVPTEVIKAFTPTGRLRASINQGNPILAGKDPSTGAPVGVSVDLANAFAKRLGVDIDLIVFDAAGKSVDAVANGQADIGFFAIDPLRGESINFTQAYILIEGSYLVRSDSPLKANEEVDVAGRSVVVGKGSAYDLYLSRELKYAKIFRSDTSPKVVDFYVQGGYDVAAGVKQQLEMDAARVGGLRLLPGRFMVIQQAMGCPKEKGPEAAAVLSQFVEDMKSNQFVAQSLVKHQIKGASVAPARAGSY